MALVKITWNNNSIGENGFNIYRSSSPMDISNMPAPIATVGANIGSYDDTDVVSGTEYYYRIGVFSSTDEIIGTEFKVLTQDTTIYENDVFGDGSVVATFTFNDTLQSMDSAYTLSYNSTTIFSDNSIEGKSFEINNSTNQRLTTTMDINPSSFSVAGWFYFTSKKRANIFGFGAYTIGLWSEAGDDFWINESGTYNAIGFSHPIPLNTWIYIVGSFDIQNLISSIYFDGELIIQTPNNTTTYPTDFRLMGRDNFDHSQAPGSRVDHIRIFNRALSSDEAYNLYNTEQI